MSNLSTATTPDNSQQWPSPPPGQKPIAKPIRRREKIQLSCTLCRSKKLKCDRNQPCRSCSGRGLASSCTYPTHNIVGGVDKRRASRNTGNGNIQNKINQLEGLVISLMSSLNASKGADSKSSDIETAVPPKRVNESIHASGNLEKLEEGKLSDTFGRITLEKARTTYVDSNHWTSVLDGISELKDYFEEETSPVEETASETPDLSVGDPQLLFGLNSRATKQEIIASLPPRPQVDRLVSSYFESMDMAPVIVHVRTFLKEYESFWLNPSETPVVWLGLLFGVLCLSIHCRDRESRNQEKLPYGLAHNREFHNYRERLVQCLIIGKYTNPTRYTVETLCMYFAVEHFRCPDTQFGTYVLLGMIVRIAMRAGYHRDPSYYPKMSPYHAEMRRRTWTMVVQVDMAMSHQVGLPRMIQKGMYDTELPRNIVDDDFDEHTVELPPPRADTDITLMSYVIAKHKICLVKAEIIDLTANVTAPPYSEVLRHDNLLDETVAALPSPFQAHAPDYIQNETPLRSMQRMYFRILIDSSRCTLHRSYRMLGRTNPAYMYSRHISLSAAMQIIQHQAKDLSSSQLRRHKWKLSSAIHHDFLVGTTTLCLDMNETLVEGDVEATCAGEFDTPEGKEKIISAMRQSYEVWTSLSDQSKEARRGAEALRVVLDKIGKKAMGASYTTAESTCSNPIMATTPLQQPLPTNFADHSLGQPSISLAPNFSEDKGGLMPPSEYLNWASIQVSWNLTRS
ncbi:hypothetical protein BJ875DRAFT_188438 [Amylocarpus encephaloides]|uniref:Zn(2)-C6 fungal-type domain-containing protein n=1 Tax=Amylocarpus encephaloides TaxID=45428 RepID=A0A9P7YTC2_9HELO|nr:hypothetical protein BJ875DRAFT_188438 [Amylocarpus encephaloides]